MDDEQRSARAARQRERKAENKALDEAWKATVDGYFGFLRTDYGFRITKVYRWGWGKEATYQSPVLAIRVDASVEFNRVELTFYRLIDGKTRATRENSFIHDALLRDRTPKVETQLASLKGLSDENVRTSPALLAQAVKEHATDLLSGDLSYFDILNSKRGNTPQ
ncbi:MAG TPA: hypothetical protein VFQ25_17580 [Ktedonobacterales bacterium]|nr:hypothetical protein [Ktedonobacterales bacterium]